MATLALGTAGTLDKAVVEEEETETALVKVEAMAELVRAAEMVA